MYKFVFCLAACVVGVGAGTALAQQPADEHAGHVMPDAHAGHDMVGMARDGSGTAWLPDQSPMYAVHATRGAWTLMFHENAFLQYLRESGDRGDGQLGSINWVMGMAQRRTGSGTLGLRLMMSAEPATIRDCGYPDLLATGERCEGRPIHDRQHPHDLLMEVAARYDAPLTGGLRWQAYAGLAGEPALGPVAFPHRVSAMPNPLAPISHHWLDSTHVTFGVVTGGIYGSRWKAEASAFNGREPDEHRTDVNLAALDSYAGRLWLMPAARVALQVSAGRLREAEAAEPGESRADVTRVTASLTYHAMFRERHLWASTVAWGRNSESHHASAAVLAETSLTFAGRDTVYGRLEVAGKSGHDLVAAVPPDDLFTVAKLQGGYTRYLAPRRGFQPGVGLAASMSLVPESLVATYGARANPGIALYLTLRPASMN